MFFFVSTCGLMIFLPHSCEKVGNKIGVEVSWNNISSHLEVRSTLLNWVTSPGCHQRGVLTSLLLPFMLLEMAAWDA